MGKMIKGKGITKRKSAFTAGFIPAKECNQRQPYFGSIRRVRHKTGVPFQVKLLDIPLQIIERYKAFQENNLVFPNLNYWSICKRMGKMIKECGITKKISFHCSRHGFATLALSKGMPIESVSRILGHTNIETTQIYAKITVQKLDNDLTMLSDKLSKSFGNVKMAGI